MLKDMGEVMTAAAYYLGFDQCTEKPEEGQKILELLEKQKPAVKIYSAEGTVDRVADGEVTMEHMWNGSFHRAQLNLWGDNFAVPKGAKHIENAKLFLNFMMDPKNAAEASNFTGYNNAITGSEQYLKDDLRNDPAFNTPETMVPRLKQTRLCSKAALDLRERIWTRLLR
jgi:spermidine/putrescine transport system substrate-binding protein